MTEEEVKEKTVVADIFFDTYVLFEQNCWSNKTLPLLDTQHPLVREKMS